MRPPPEPDRETESQPPFLKRRMGYGTVGGCLGCLTVILFVIVLFLLVGLLFGPDINH